LIRSVTVILAFILGCSASLSWEAVETDHVESLDAFLHGDDVLDVHIESGRGIGSVTLQFEEPVRVDSISVTLMYDSLNPYHFCESMSLAFTGRGDSSLWMVDHSMIDLGEDGSVSFREDDGFMTLRISWIDFYRQ